MFIYVVFGCVCVPMIKGTPATDPEDIADIFERLKDKLWTSWTCFFGETYCRKTFIKQLKKIKDQKEAQEI